MSAREKQLRGFGVHTTQSAITEIRRQIFLLLYFLGLNFELSVEEFVTKGTYFLMV